MTRLGSSWMRTLLQLTNSQYVSIYIDVGPPDYFTDSFPILITSPPEGVTRYCFDPVCLSVCLYVCMCVCVSGQYFGILFLSY